ncbi:hypothetical protein ANANG_G00197660 [Anguilla anguilla]|uniref:Uncharacterized protein n=1 Tax=Anguilla anguilla TaxID=7936 RepID=A0A9D3RSI0_ANGAN|nr:hypothetical protein ANANG_G00197660 [Anguilla anguilla]
MAFKPEQEVQPENIEMIGCPVQESSCVKTRPWPSSDKQSHNHPGAVDTLGTNSKPVFAHDEEMTKTGVEEEGLAVCEMMEKVEGVEEGKMEKKAEEKVAEAKLGVLCSLVDMPGSCLSQEAEPQSPTMDEHKPCPDGSTAEGHIKVTDRIAGQKKVFWKRQKAEAAGTEGGPQNTRAPFRLQDFMCFKISKLADNKGSVIGIGIIIISIIFIIIGVGIIILIAVLIWKRNIIIFRRNSCGQGQDRDHRHGNNGVPPHDAEHRDENTIEMQPLKGEVPNGNVNGVHREDGSVGTAG